MANELKYSDVYEERAAETISRIAKDHGYDFVCRALIDWYAQQMREDGYRLPATKTFIARASDEMSAAMIGVVRSV